ncbi:hypothetical protein [Actinophytocola sp.]|uniref:hypothetical protein n=1 Tax=Actinophytocola sp. TaxID=1872138 RepID=UPI002D5EC5EE|nr:hypothetical protein [Actinophytocola sp.]HYQ61695.1 hypothetical protein [Actinophytocola sp.]
MTYGPPQGGYPAGSPPAMGQLLVHSSFNAMAFMLAFTGPRVTINGHPASVRWGTAPFNLPAGNHHLRVSTRYLGDFGPAELPVTIYPGQQTTVYYRPPAVIGMQGSIGFAPQGTRGISAIMAINVIAIVILVAVVVAIAVS